MNQTTLLEMAPHRPGTYSSICLPRWGPVRSSCPSVLAVSEGCVSACALHWHCSFWLRINYLKGDYTLTVAYACVMKVDGKNE